MTVNVSKPVVNVREKLAELDKPTGIAGEAMLRAETPQEQFNLIGAGRRNWIINGDFQVSQRGDYTSATSLTTSGTYYVDRWSALIFSGNNGTIQKVTNQTLPNGRITDSLKLVSNVASGQYALWQWVEDYKAFRGQEATLSFWYKSNCDQAFNYYTYAAQTHINLPNTNGQWVYFTHTRRHETNATGMRIEFYPFGVTLQSSAYIEIAQVQLELGKVATPFEHRSYGEELALCQRYYQRLGNNDGSNTHLMVGSAEGSGVYVVSRALATPMRAVPTFTLGNAVRAFTASAGVQTVSSFNTRCSRDIACISANVTGTATTGQAAVLYGADAINSTGKYIELDAEL